VETRNLTEQDMSDPHPQTGQDRIRTGRIERSVSLVGTGARVGINYLKHYGKSTISGKQDEDELHRENANVVYKTFSDLKGGPLKMAQMLSIDQNLLPGPYASEFAQAQYSAPPLSYPLVARTFRREFGKEPNEIFETFSRHAAHGASIGQVHKASREGKDYAVKIQYPGVAKSLRSDLAVVKPIALQIMDVREEDVAEYFREVEERLLEETDYGMELDRSRKLSGLCSHIPHLRFPRYYAEFSSNRILTMDWIEGQTLDTFADSDADQEARDRIGQALWDFYDYQIHELKLFHADPHPGNFIVQGDELVAIDFGCTKELEEVFYFKNFRFLDPDLLEDHARLEEALYDLKVLLPGDEPEDRQAFMDLCIPTLDILARPFRFERFDFGNADFMRAIYETGERNRTHPTLKRMRGARGSRHSVYVNRAYFGLYSLLSRLRARVNIRLPDWLRNNSAAPVA
jgi:predicted unusual protein kinase regulating ubiquinone biosynthesis (AarF/ABC1/UbiB family)